MESVLLMRGEGSAKEVYIKGLPSFLRVQPGVMVARDQLGVIIWLSRGVAVRDTSVWTRFWGHKTLHDPIACWRGTLILQCMNAIEEKDLPNAFWAGMRSIQKAESYRVVSVCEKIGKDNYNKIMSQPIPLAIIGWIMQLSREGDKSLAAYTLSEEYGAGTIPKWRDEFDSILARQLVH